MDGAGWHKSKGLRIPETIKIMFLPPYSPELNPIERLWGYIKSHLIRNKVYETLEALEDAVCSFMQTLLDEKIQKICSINYLTS